jgi:hypothetical protein
LATSGTKDTSRFIIGPVTQQSFGQMKSQTLTSIEAHVGAYLTLLCSALSDHRLRPNWTNSDLELGNTAEEYLSAVAKCEIAWIREFGSRKLQSIPLLSEMKLATPEIHIQLEQYLCVLPISSFQEGY